MRGDGVVDPSAARAALDVYEVDELGLDRLDRAVLEALCRRFGGGPVGLSTLAVAVGEEPETVETVAEPFLVREGLLGRTPRGRRRDPGGVEAPRPARPDGGRDGPGGSLHRSRGDRRWGFRRVLTPRSFGPLLFAGTTLA